MCELAEISDSSMKMPIPMAIFIITDENECLMELKQVIIVRNDLKLPKGKIAAQVAHASLESALRTKRDKLDRWRAAGMKKIVLKVEALSELMKFLQLAKDAGFSTALITDAGHTVVEPGTVTCLGIGPDDEVKIDRLTGNLPML